ncbi:MAG: hypothetical protein IJV02_00180 [Candidatus Methanomethylophilaceae archaeon]|nr:hypothetical protein [Candidatus Methanomethylophilaceae archaeon]
MAYDEKTKEKALKMYFGGVDLKTVSSKCKVPERTVLRWVRGVKDDISQPASENVIQNVTSDRKNVRNVTPDDTDRFIADYKSRWIRAAISGMDHAVEIANRKLDEAAAIDGEQGIYATSTMLKTNLPYYSKMAELADLAQTSESRNRILSDLVRAMDQVIDPGEKWEE